MGAKPNTELIVLTKEYFSKNYPRYKTISKLVEEFRSDYPNIPTSVVRLRQYFSILINAKDSPISTNENTDTLNIEETLDGKFINYKGEKSITSLEEAIKFFEIDTKVWEVESWKCKSWDTSMNIRKVVDGGSISEPVKRTNYAVSLTLKRKISEVDYNKIYDNIDNLYKNYPKVKEVSGNNACVLTIADLHIGLKVTKKGGIINTPEFNSDSVIRYLNEIAERVNALKYKEVHLVILGDLVESVSGYNHIETLKEMESTITGGNIIILAYEILKGFIAKINNLKRVYMISGNHDRLTPDKAMDKDGGACQIISYMLQNIVETEWHPILMSKVIDNINYILTHGHLKIAMQDLGKIFFEYGSQDRYNVMLSGHWHVRKTNKVFSEKNIILADTSKYRAITVPPITSGTRWTEENGWSCNPGFTIIEANKTRTNINHYDFSLN